MPTDMEGLVGMAARSMTSSSTDTRSDGRDGNSKNSSLHDEDISTSLAARRVELKGIDRLRLGVLVVRVQCFINNNECPLNE
jgi:hypothetical protein